MRILSKSTLLQFGRRHPDADQSLRAWLADAKAAKWNSPADVKARYPHASLIGGKRVVFNIGGNKYRLITEIGYAQGVVYVLFLGTHREYDKVNAETVLWNKKS